MNTKKILAMLLAGGAGTRLNILSETRAKPAVPFGGIYRIIDFTLSNILHAGLGNVGVLTQYRPLSLMEHIGSGSSWDFIGLDRSIRILPPQTGKNKSDWYKGTADACYLNLGYMDRFQPEQVLILSGDHIYKMDYQEMINFHCQKGADVTIATLVVPWEEASRFGLVMVDDDQRVVEFQEKPDQPGSNLASMGIYVFEYSVLRQQLLDVVGGMKKYDFGQDILPHMLSGGKKMYAYPFKGYWRDVGTIKSFWDAQQELLNPDSPFDLSRWQVYTNPEDRNLSERGASRLGKHALVLNSYVSKGCVVKGKVVNSILSPGVLVEKNSIVQNSILMHDCQIEENCFIDFTIMDKDVKVGSGASIGTGEESQVNIKFPSHLNSGITLVGKGANIPSGTVIGKNCLLFPGVKGKLFAKKEVGSGEVVGAVED